MPNYKKHLFGGIIVYIIVLYAMISLNPSLTTAIQWLICCLIGSLFPDIDTKSKIQKIFYTALLFVFITLTIHNKNQILIPLSFIAIIPLIVNHRGLFHNIWFIIFINLAILFIVSLYAPKQLMPIVNNSVFFLAGIISHLWLDLGPKKMFRI